MDTLKTGFIVLLLLAVLYGVYVVLNKDQTPPNAEIAWHQQQAEQELQIDIGKPADPVTSGNAVSGKLAGEPDLLRTPGSAAAANKAAKLGLPSVVTAELSPIPDDSATLHEVPKVSTAAVNSPERDAPRIPDSATPVSPVAPIVTGPKPNDVGVPAPSLLPKNLTSEAKSPDKPSAGAAARSGDLTSLPALRESATAWPDPEPSALPVRPAIKVPDRPTDTNSPTTTEQLSSNVATPVVAPPPLRGSSPADEAISTDVEPKVPDDLTRNAEPDAAGPSTKSVTTATAFEAAMREAQSNLGEEQWYQALFVLSKFYNSPDLTSQQQQELLNLLDPLAAKVVYSHEHLVTDAHEVRRGETLAQIATAMQVPPELISNINGIENPDVLIPGTKLKIVRGPFRADVDLQKKELTLFAGQLYAGRFPISVGQDPEPKPGEYRVLEKQPGRDYFAATDQKIAADDPQNPFGRVWIGLEKELAIHGSPERGDAGTMGCISLSPLDATDVYSILVPGSTVTIRR